MKIFGANGQPFNATGRVPKSLLPQYADLYQDELEFHWESMDPRKRALLMQLSLDSTGIKMSDKVRLYDEVIRFLYEDSPYSYRPWEGA